MLSYLRFKLAAKSWIIFFDENGFVISTLTLLGSFSSVGNWKSSSLRITILLISYHIWPLVGYQVWLFNVFSNCSPFSLIISNVLFIFIHVKVYHFYDKCLCSQFLMFCFLTKIGLHCWPNQPFILQKRNVLHIVLECSHPVHTYLF